MCGACLSKKNTRGRTWCVPRGWSGTRTPVACGRRCCGTSGPQRRKYSPRLASGVGCLLEVGAREPTTRIAWLRFAAHAATSSESDALRAAGGRACRHWRRDGPLDTPGEGGPRWPCCVAPGGMAQHDTPGPTRAGRYSGAHRTRCSSVQADDSSIVKARQSHTSKRPPKLQGPHQRHHSCCIQHSMTCLRHVSQGVCVV